MKTKYKITGGIIITVIVVLLGLLLFSSWYFGFFFPERNNNDDEKEAADRIEYTYVISNLSENNATVIVSMWNIEYHDYWNFTCEIGPNETKRYSNQVRFGETRNIVEIQHRHRNKYSHQTMGATIVVSEEKTTTNVRIADGDYMVYG